MSVTEANKAKYIVEESIEIRLSDIIQLIKDNKRYLFLGILIGGLLGAIYAFSKPNIYSVQVTVMPEAQAKGAGLGNLGSLAGLAGINVDNLNLQDAIRPELYPDVLQSIPFALELLKQPVYTERLKTRIPLQEFINRMNKDSFLGRLLNSYDDSSESNNQYDPKNFSKAIQVTKQQEQLIKVVRTSVSATYDKKTGVFTVTANEPDPVVAATVARLALEYLTNYITNYRTEKARKQVQFLTQQVKEAKIRYQAAEYNISNYKDQNRNLFLNTAKIAEERLQSDYLLAQSVYAELSKQLEQAKIRVQEETPVFKILEPPTIPLRKSGPKRSLIIVGFAVVGCLIALVTVLVRQFINSYTKHVL